MSSKIPASLTAKSMDHRTKVYALTAAAAGVSILALAQPALGEVVVTRKTIPIPGGGFNLPPSPVSISLNNDAVKDFSFSLYTFAYHSFRDDLQVRALEGGALVGAPNRFSGFYASALARGAKIGPSAHFSTKGVASIERAEGFDASSQYSRRLYGDWGDNPANRYIGVRFLIKGQTHYGWVRLTVTTEPRGFSAEITAYAYETIADKRILAGISSTADDAQAASTGRPGGTTSANPTLGMLALGASGLAMWR